MAKQWQIRRGTTAENDDFTGAAGEVTMDTTTNGLRIHDGSTQGGIEVPTAGTSDYVVEFQAPTAENNYTWYRKYRSGWVEQGGYIAQGAAQANTVIFSIPFAAKDYIPTVTGDWTGSTGAACTVNWSAATTTQMVVTKDGTAMGAFWKAEGMAA